MTATHAPPAPADLVYLDVHGRIDQDLPCFNPACKYNLRGMLPEGVCPECRCPVGDALRPDLMRFAPARGVRRLILALRWFVVALLVPVVLGALPGIPMQGFALGSVCLAVGSVALARVPLAGGAVWHQVLRRAIVWLSIVLAAAVLAWVFDDRDRLPRTGIFFPLMYCLLLAAIIYLLRSHAGQLPWQKVAQLLYACQWSWLVAGFMLAIPFWNFNWHSLDVLAVGISMLLTFLVLRAFEHHLLAELPIAEQGPASRR